MNFGPTGSLRDPKNIYKNIINWWLHQITVTCWTFGRGSTNQFHTGVDRGRFRKCRDNSSCFRDNVSSTAQQQFPERDPRHNFLRLGGNLDRGHPHGQLSRDRSKRWLYIYRALYTHSWTHLLHCNFHWLSGTHLTHSCLLFYWVDFAQVKVQYFYRLRWSSHIDWTSGGV